MAIRYYKDDVNDYLVYAHTITGKVVRVSLDDLMSLVEVCEMWHGGPNSPCDFLTANDFSYRNLQRTLNELQRAQQAADESGVEINEDDYLDLLTAIEDLEGILRRIDAIA